MKTVFITLCLLVMALPAAMSQEPAGARSSGIIGKLDSVEIRVFREDELTTRGQLEADGTIAMPFIGKVTLQGLSTAQAAALIAAKLRDGYLVRPEVSVTIENRVRRTVTILGQAQSPGVFELPANRPLTVVEAIGMAGGLTRIANPRKITLKRLTARGGAEVTRVNLSDITSGKAGDITLRNGDVVTIPESLF